MKKNTKTSTAVFAILALGFITWGYKAFAPATPLSPLQKEETSSIIHASYTCANNEAVHVSYDNTDPKNQKALFSSKKITERILPHVISGSGARYSDGTYVWWSKGDTGFLMEATGSEKMLITDCVVKK